MLQSIMYISTYNSYINPVGTYNKQETAPLTKPQTSFKEQLLYKTIDTYNVPKSFPIDYINKESTFFNKLRMQQDISSDEEISKSLDESRYVSSFNILKKRESAYQQTSYKITSLQNVKYTLAPKLGSIDFTAQKADAANIYIQNDAYFHKRAV
ncbi:hypothetical protein [Sulfurimonas sp. HSL-1716]|uniref:hypothetical protein n=1 Tax=Hydrocurvibacter sulfurireducens TaxID=3131937 RepID=UPI0031F82BEC